MVYVGGVFIGCLVVVIDGWCGLGGAFFGRVVCGDEFGWDGGSQLVW